MKIERRDNSRQRMILTAMIVNTKVLAQISLRWTKDGLFPDTWSNIIGNLCIKYFKLHNRAPRRRIEAMFATWAEDQGDKETVKLVERFLGGLSGQWEKERKKISTKLVLDIASEYFQIASIRKLIEVLEGDLLAGKSNDAIKHLNKFMPTETGVQLGTDVFQNRESFEQAFSEKRESIIKYPGDLGRFYGDSLEQDGFVAYLAPEKRGKTFHLLDMAYRGVSQRKRIAFFQVGDLTQRQMIMRIGSRVSGLPTRPTYKDRPLKIPTGKLDWVDDTEAGVLVSCDYKIKHFKEGLSWQDAWRAVRKLQKETIRSKESYFKMFVYPNSSISVSGIRVVLDMWIRQGWKPDAVIIDYADILANPPGFQGDSRDAINESWKAMRRMSQELHTLVVTATQANAASYQTKLLSMANFSEDKRKFAHVTGMVGINQTDEEKVKGIQSLNWLVLREDEFVSTKQVYLAGCLGIANPCIKSLM